MNFRPDQLARFHELFPDKQFAPVVRDLVDSFLDGDKPTQRRLDEVRRLRAQMESKLAGLKALEHQLETEEHKEIMGKALDEYRLDIINNRPEILDKHKSRQIGHKGYAELQKLLKLPSRQKLIEFLDSRLNNNGTQSKEEELG